MLKKYIVIIGLSLMPSLLVFSGKNDRVFEWCDRHKIFVNTEGLDENAKNEKKSNFQFVSFSVGILFTGLIIPARLAHVSHQFDNKSKSMSDLMQFNRNALLETLTKEVNRKHHPLKMYIFVPSQNIFSLLWAEITRKVILTLKDIDGVTDKFHSDGLTIAVSKKKVEGVVGTAYLKKDIIIADGKMELRGFYLNEIQKNTVNSIEFCAAMPIFAKNSIVGILSIDSPKAMNMSADEIEEFKKTFIELAAFISKHKLII